MTENDSNKIYHSINQTKEMNINSNVLAEKLSESLHSWHDPIKELIRMTPDK